MKIRLAKKIMFSHNKNWDRKFNKLRPPIQTDDGNIIYPSWHDIDIIRRAYQRLLKWKKGRKNERDTEERLEVAAEKYVGNQTGFIDGAK